MVSELKRELKRKQRNVIRETQCRMCVDGDSCEIYGGSFGDTPMQWVDSVCLSFSPKHNYDTFCEGKDKESMYENAQNDTAQRRLF